MANRSLSSLDTGQQDPPPIESGDGTKTAADLEAERIKAAEEEKKPLVDQNPGDKAKTEAQIAAEAEEARLKKEQDDKDDAAPETSIWEDVDKLRGEAIDVEWGDIPEEERDTPRGILAREKAVEARAIQNYERWIMQSDPRGYEYLLHRQAGGTDEDFFARKTIDLPDYELFKTSVDLQTKVLTDDLRNKGVPEKQVKMLVDAAVKDKELFDLSDKAYKDKQARDTQSIEKLNKQLEAENQYYQRAVTGLTKAITEQISSADMSIVIPEAQRPVFDAFVRQHIEYNEQTKQFMFVQNIDPKVLPRQLEALYLQFKKGNLGELIRREAQTSNTKRLKRAVESTKDKINDQGGGGKRKLTLGEI